MSLSMTKKQTISMTKKPDGSERTKIRVGLGWELLKEPLDLDVAAFLTKHDPATNTSICDEDDGMIFFGQYQDPTTKHFYSQKYGKDVVHCGDNRTGAGDGDDESILIDFAMLNQTRPHINEVMVFVTVFEKDASGNPLPENQMKQHFGMMGDAYTKVYDDVTGEEICKYDLDETFPGYFGVQVGNFRKDSAGAWAFTAVGSGFNKNLLSIAKYLKVPCFS